MHALLTIWCLLDSILLSNLESSTASATLDQIVEKSLARSQRVRSGVIEYVRVRHVVKEVPRFTHKSPDDGVPYFVRFAWESNRRAVYLVPMERPDLDGSFRVYDGSGTVIGGLRDFESAGVFGHSAVIVEGREASIRNYEDQYLISAFQIPISDAARADYLDDWWFPHCVTRMQRAKDNGATRRGNAVQAYALQTRAEQVAGNWCDVVTLEGFDRVWLDPKLGWAVRRRVRWYSPEDPTVLQRYTNDDFREIEPGLWAPFRVDVETGCRNEGICQQESFVVRELRFNRVEDADFRVKLKSGAMITDIESGKFTVYREAFGDASVKELARAAKGFYRPSRTVVIALSILIVGLTSGIAWYVYRRRRWRKAQ